MVEILVICKLCWAKEQVTDCPLHLLFECSYMCHVLVLFSTMTPSYENSPEHLKRHLLLEMERVKQNINSRSHS